MGKFREVLSDEESMKQLGELAQMFSSSDAGESSSEQEEQPESDGGNNLLKEERQAKVDKAVKMLKLFAVWSVLKDSGLLKDFL